MEVNREIGGGTILGIQRGHHMNYFLCKLIPPRLSFPADMTPAERQLMQEHAVFWRGLI